MNLKLDILEQFKNNYGVSLSGQNLAEHFGVTRSAIWKAISTLRNEGCLIEGSPKTGYILKSADILEEDKIKSLLKDYPSLELYVLDRVNSTNTFGEDLLLKGLKNNALIVAKTQQFGRGRKSTEFPSRDGGLYMTLVFFPKTPPEKTFELSNQIYKCVHNILGGSLKESSIYIKNKKACGILTEYALDPDRIKYCIAGIGIYTDLLDQKTKEKYPSKNQICANIVKEIFNNCK